MVEICSLVEGVSEMRCEKHKCKLLYSLSCLRFYCPRCTEEAENTPINARGSPVVDELKAEGIITHPPKLKQKVR